jgi:hypothetical protein
MGRIALHAVPEANFEDADAATLHKREKLAEMIYGRPFQSQLANSRKNGPNTLEGQVRIDNSLKRLELRE